MKLLLKVWTTDRLNKKFIFLDECEDDENFYNSFIINASQKLGISATGVALESDGTVVDDGAALKMLHKEIFVLLTNDEKWVPLGYSPMPSTVSVTSSVNTIDEYLENANDENVQISESKNQSDTSVPQRISESTWHNFELPWHCLNKMALTEIEKGIRTTEVLNKIVNVTVDATREITRYPGNKAYRIVSKKIVDKYPQFRDIDDDEVLIGNGHHSLFKKLTERNNYLNRAHKRPSNSLQLPEIPPKNLRKMANCKSGCSNWQPLVIEEYDNPETLVEKKNLLNSENINFDDANTQRYLNDTYGILRQFLNNSLPPTVEDIIREWPITFKPRMIEWHFLKLVGCDLNEFRQIFQQKKRKIFKFAQLVKYIYPIETQNEGKELTSALGIISYFFKEEIKFLVQNQEETGTYNLLAPRIVISDIHEIYIEKIKVVESQDFVTAFQFLFALYYILNMSYPKEVSSTLEFIQRYFFKINPVEGTKSKKKSLNKIISLITKLRNIDV